jgi:hypothetical protein
MVSATPLSHSSPLPQNGFLTSQYLSRAVPPPPLTADEPDTATAATMCARASPLLCFDFRLPAQPDMGRLEVAHGE